MSFAENALEKGRPESIRGDVSLPRRRRYHPSPADWRDEVLYFLMIDRFSDGQEDARPELNRDDLNAARPQSPDGEPWKYYACSMRMAGRAVALMLSSIPV